MQEEKTRSELADCFSKPVLDRLARIFIDAVNLLLTDTRRGRTPPNRKDFPENLLEVKLPRPSARKVVIQAARQNIPWNVQLKIFQHSNLSFKEILAILSNKEYKFEILEPDHPQEKFWALADACEWPAVRAIIELDSNPAVNVYSHRSHVLYLACQAGHLPMVEYLLQLPGIDPYTDNPIVSACENGHTDVVRRMLNDSRVDPSCQESLAIQVAAQEGHAQIVRMLMADSRVDTTRNNSNPMKCACANGYLEVVKLLLTDPKVDPSTDDNYPFKIATQGGFVDIVKLLLVDSRIDPCNDDDYAFRTATEGSYKEIVELMLLDPRINPAADDNFAIKVACDRGSMEIFLMLLHHPKVDVAAENNYALRIACIRDNVEMVKILLKEEKVDPTALDNYAFRSLGESGNTEIARLLMDDGRIDPCADENYALKVAVASNYTKFVRLLLTDPRISLNDEPIYLTICDETNADMLKVMLADPNVSKETITFEGLQMSVERGDLDCVKLLCVDSRLEVEMQQGLVHTAASEGHTDIVKYFEETMKFDLTFPKHHPLLAALQNNHVATAEAMMENYIISKSSSFDSILKTTIKHGHFEFFKLVVEKYWAQYGIRIVKAIFLALACAYGHLDLVKYIVEKNQSMCTLDLYKKLQKEKEKNFLHNFLSAAYRTADAAPCGPDAQQLKLTEEHRKHVLNSALMLAEIDAENNDRSPVEKIATLNKHIQRLRQLQKRTQQQIDLLMAGFENAQALIDRIDGKQLEDQRQEAETNGTIATTTGTLPQPPSNGEKCDRDEVDKDQAQIIDCASEDEVNEMTNEVKPADDGENEKKEVGRCESENLMSTTNAATNGDRVWLENPLYLLGHEKERRTSLEAQPVNREFADGELNPAEDEAIAEVVPESTVEGVPTTRIISATPALANGDASCEVSREVGAIEGGEENEKQLHNPCLERDRDSIPLKELMRRDRKMKLRNPKHASRADRELQRPHLTSLPNLRAGFSFATVYDYPDNEPVKDIAHRTSTAIGFASYIGRMDIVLYLHQACPDVDLSDAITWSYLAPAALLAVMPAGEQLAQHIDAVPLGTRLFETITLLAWHFWPKVKYLWLGFFHQEESVFAELPHEILTYHIFSKMLDVYSYLLDAQ